MEIYCLQYWIRSYINPLILHHSTHIYCLLICKSFIYRIDVRICVESRWDAVVRAYISWPYYLHFTTYYAVVSLQNLTYYTINKEQIK